MEWDKIIVAATEFVRVVTKDSNSIMFSCVVIAFIAAAYFYNRYLKKKESEEYVTLIKETTTCITKNYEVLHNVRDILRSRQ